MMLKNRLFLIFLLCVGLFLGARTDGKQDGKNSTRLESNNADIVVSSPSSGGVVASPSSGRVSRLPLVLMRMMYRSARACVHRIVSYLRPIIKGAMTLMMDLLKFFAYSDDTRMVRRRRSADNYDPHYRAGGDGLVSALRSAMFKPFGIVYGAVAALPVEDIYRRTASMLAPLSELSNNLLVQLVTNATTSVADVAANQVWGFSKVHILPRLDTAITKLHNSHAVPQSIMSRLDELQTLYHVFKLFNMA